MQEANSVQSVLRALTVIEALNHRDVTSVATLHQITGLPKATLIRLLGTLNEAGYVTHVSRSAGYALTERVLGLSVGFRERDAAVAVARPLVEAFTRKHKWQVAIGTFERDAMLVRFNTREISPFAPDEIYLNHRLSVLSCGLGRAYLSYCSDYERDFILRILRASGGDDAARAGDTAWVDHLISTVRRDRYAMGERTSDDPVRSFGIPVFHPRQPDQVACAISFFYYRKAMTEAQAIEGYLDKMYDLAARISAALGAVKESDAITSLGPASLRYG